MTNDSDKADASSSVPRDSEQAYRAYEMRNVATRLGQGPHGYSTGSKLLFEQAMGQTRMAVCLSDPNHEDAPIVFANRGFLELTGYEEDEVLGRNCRFLQGEDTDMTEVAKVRKALDEESVAVVELLNYRKSGEAFWNALHIGPIYGDDGRLLYYFGSQWDVTKDRAHQRLLARELSHRMQNMFAVINAVVLMAGQGGPERTALANDISGRIMALARAQEATLVGASKSGRADLEPLVREILSAYDAGGRVTMAGERVHLDSSVVSMLALTVHELAINAVKHGALREPKGRVEISWQGLPAAGGGNGPHASPETLELHWEERDGPAIPGVPERSGFGNSIVESLLRIAQGDVERDWRPEGLRVKIRLPLAD